MNTPLTRLLGIQTPIVGAPMFGASGGALAASVTLAGGFGFIGAGYSFYKNISAELDIAEQKLSISEGNSKPIPIGIGFITWEVVAASSKTQSQTGAKWPLVDIALARGVQAVWFSFGDASELIQYVRTKSPETKIFAQVQTTEEAVKAVEEWKVDVVVLQGSESGGHGAVSNLTTFTLVPHAIAELSRITPRVPVLAAGGVFTGQQVAAALALGADGVVLGSALLASPESLFSSLQKDAIVKAKDGTATVRTHIFDVGRGIDWPSHYNGRALKNKTTEGEKEVTSATTERFRVDYNKAVVEGDVSRQAVFVGQGVGMLTGARPAFDIVRQLTTDAIAEICRLKSLTNIIPASSLPVVQMSKL